MSCSSCGAENRPEASFCRGCGQKLGVACPHCGVELPAVSPFCDRCGRPLQRADANAPRPREPRSYTPRHLAERILTSRSALEGERKQVTILFVDIKSSLELSRDVDPEEWHRILDAFFLILAEGVHRYEGTINQYTGDGIMALFGAPIAHEDHARRACFAALRLADELRRYADDLRRARGLNASVRMGLNSGEVVVGKIGDDLRMDYTAQGHVVGLAQRMEEIAEPGKVFLSEETAALVSGYFDLRALGEFAIRGVRDPVRVHELLAAGTLRTRLDLSRERGFSRFVGRRAELALLEQALEAAEAGQGQAIGVVAEGGVGKSRLCREFAERCRAQGTRTYEAHGVSHGRRVPFLPILELLRGYFGIGEQDCDEDARRKIAGTLVLLDAELERSLPLMFEFLGVPDSEREAPRLDPEQRQSRLFRLVERVLGARSQEPALIVIDDLHWIDVGSEALVRHLVAGVASTRTLLLLNFRPEYREPWLEGDGYRRLRLLPLGPDDANEMLHDWLGDDPGVAGLSERIRERSAGNPFFIEELVRSFAESGALEGARGAYRLTAPVDEASIPETVHSILAARIDRLPEREKQVLQNASVIGNTFSHAVLSRVVALPPAELAGALRGLVDAEFVEEISSGSDERYLFRHPLTQAVAYRTLLFHRRAELHEGVARALEEASGDAPDDRGALLAHHWEAAGKPLAAARWHRRAALWVGVNDPAEALRHWKSVQALLRGREEAAEVGRLRLEAIAAVLNLGWRFGILEQDARSGFEEGRVLAEALDDPALLARLLMSYGQLIAWTTARDGGQGVDLGRDAVRLADRVDDPGLQTAARARLARAYWRTRDYRAALEVTEAGLERDPASNEHLRFHARLLTEMARLPEARRDLDRALALAREHRDVSERTLTHLCYAIWARFTGDFDLERAHAQAALDLAERTGDLFARTQSLTSLGESHLWVGRFREAIALLEQALVAARERDVYAEAGTLGLLTDAYLGPGDMERASRTAEEAMTLEGEDSIQALLAFSRVLRRRNGRRAHRRIAETLDRAQAFVERSGAASWEPHIRVERAELARLTGDRARWERELHEAHRLLEAMGAPHHVRWVEGLLAERGNEPRQP